MVYKLSKDPTCKGPAGTSAGSSLKDRNFAKPVKGSHSGAMKGADKTVDIHKVLKKKKGR